MNQELKISVRMLFCIFLISQFISDNAGAVALISVDASNCREFIAIESTKQAPYERTMSWIFGFLSGVATAGDRDVLRGRDHVALANEILFYCRQNPNASLDTAAANLFLALTRK